jgi:hypothetical protein
MNDSLANQKNLCIMRSGMPDAAINLGLHTLIQVISGFLCLRIFLPPDVPRRGWPLLLCSVLMIALSLGVETVLDPWIFEGTLIFQWVLFVLLCHRICRLPLLHSMAALVCYFSFMLGLGMLCDPVADPADPPDAAAESTEDAFDPEQLLEAGLLDEDSGTRSSVGSPDPSSREVPAWILKLHDRMLHRKLGRAQQRVWSLLYNRPDTKPAPSPTPTPEPLPTATPTPQPGTPMSDEEFLDLFRPTPTPRPVPTAVAPLPGASPTPQGGHVVKPGDVATVNSEQLTEIVKLKNRSTDPRFTPPEYEITAIGVGVKGRYAIIRGQMMREGNILRTGTEPVRGWRLIRIQEDELYWQPLL